jgi:hypothetical protein
MWLHWILFMGAVASNLLPERFLFIEELARLCRLVGLSRMEGRGGVTGCLL